MNATPAATSANRNRPRKGPNHGKANHDATQIAGHRIITGYQEGRWRDGLSWAEVFRRVDACWQRKCGGQYSRFA